MNPFVVMTCKWLNLISSRDLCSLSCDPGVTPFLLESPRSIICSHLEWWNPIVSLSPNQCRAIILVADRAEWRWMWEQLTENLDPKVTTVNPSCYPSHAVFPESLLQCHLKRQTSGDGQISKENLAVERYLFWKTFNFGTIPMLGRNCTKGECLVGVCGDKGAWHIA